MSHESDIINSIFGTEGDVLEDLDPVARQIAETMSQQLMLAIVHGERDMFVMSVLTLTMIGVGYHGKDKWVRTAATAELHYRAGREALKGECRSAVDDLIASIRADA